MPPTDAGSAIAAGDTADELRADAGSAIAAVDTASELRARLARRREEMQHLSSELALFQTTTALLVVVLAAVALWMRCGERSRLQRLSACAMPAGDDDSGEAPRCVPCWELWRRPAWGQELDEVAERFEDGDEEEFTRAEVLAHLKQEVKTKGRMSHVGIVKDKRSKKEANASKGAGAGVPAEFEIERLLGSRAAAGGAEYLVHWKVATGRRAIHALPCTVH